MKSLLTSLLLYPYSLLSVLLSYHSAIQIAVFISFFVIIIYVRDTLFVKTSYKLTPIRLTSTNFYSSQNFSSVTSLKEVLLLMYKYTAQLVSNTVYLVLNNSIQYKPRLVVGNNFGLNMLTVINFKWTNLMQKSFFLDTFWLRSYLIWNDGFLFDFAQKKTADLWVRKFVILTGFLFSDRYLFDSIVRIYNDNLINPLQSIASSELENVNSMLGNILFTISTLFISSTLLILIIL